MRLMKWAMTSVALMGLTAAAHANLVTNPDFAPGNPAPGYGAVAGWTQSPYPSTLNGYPYLTGSNTAGGAFWDNGTTGGPTTAGFVQVYAGTSIDSFSQTLTLLPGQSYYFSFLENARSGTAPLVSVTVGGNTLVAQHLDTAVGGSNPFRLYTGAFTATSASETLTFLVSQAHPGDDATALFTGVSVTETPEPSSLALLGTGMLGAVGFVRRKMAKS